MGNVNNSRKAVIEHSRMLAHALSQSNDPKFQVCVVFLCLMNSKVSTETRRRL